jgi:hypothetical protein
MERLKIVFGEGEFPLLEFGSVRTAQLSQPWFHSLQGKIFAIGSGVQQAAFQ